MARVAGEEFTAFETLTVGAASTGLTASSISGKTVAYITCETAQIRFRLDGTAPTTSVGHILDAGDNLTLEGSGTLANAKFIRTGSNSAVLQCSYGG